MTRFALIPLLFLVACSREAADPQLTAGTYIGEGRDRLCIAGANASQRVGLISYGANDANCSVSGRIERVGAEWAIRARGDAECRIQLKRAGKALEIGVVPASCNYYCGPGVRLEGQRFSLIDGGAAVIDLAGDPLC